MNDGTTYAGRPVGNSPEMMPLDCSLNKDVDCCVDRHIFATKHLYDSTKKVQDERIFSMATPKEITRAYKRVWNPKYIGPEEGAASSRRIIEDTDKFIVNCVAIAKHCGTVVQGLGCRSGWRLEASSNIGDTEATTGEIIGKKSGGHHPKSPQGSSDSYWYHPDAEASSVERTNICLHNRAKSEAARKEAESMTQLNNVVNETAAASSPMRASLNTE